MKNNESGNKSKSLTKNAILNMIKTVSSLLFPLITFPYSSRILGPEGLGKIHWAESFVFYFVILAELGITNYATREASKLRDNKIELSKFAREIFIINLISSTIAYILFFAALFTIPYLKSYSILLLVFSATILFDQIGMNWLYYSVEDFAYITIRYLIFYLLSIVLLFTTVKTENDLIQYAILMVVSSVGGNLLNFFHSHKYINLFAKTKIELKKHLKPIFVLFGMAAATQIYTILDTSMLGFIAGDEQVGFYTAATKLNKLVLQVVTSLTTVMLPRLSVYIKNNDKESFFNLAYKGFDILFLLAIPCCLGLTAISEPLIYLFSGPKYFDAIPVMRIMNPVIIIIGLSNFIGIQIFIPLNKEKWTLLSVLLGGAVNVVMNFIFISKFGAIGASIATVIAELSITVFQMILARKFLRYKPLLKKFFLYLLNSVIMLVPVVLVVIFVKNYLLSVILGIISGVIVYLLLLILQKNPMLFELFQKIKNKLKPYSLPSENDVL